MRFLLAAVAVLGLATLTSPGYAQNTQLGPDAWRASKLIGVNVYNDKNEKVGGINELILDKSGHITSVVVGAGGFLGMGEHDVAMAFDKLKWVDQPVGSRTTTTGSSSTSSDRQHYPDHAVISATKDQLKAMPQVKY